ncbi:hypothetical protein F7R91_18530 [Streptomyces luteolifulvus]|uniref:Uncharacterized protein n=1 Tax=Streptomyces luteolifulvus TaxID=2615112 RepID=A0A6H9V2U7_9ACTN|nr:hypothetical protein F7R91_18530 [Streptomyces luteolifulvus]MXM63013.1 hypothetical protein [Streptomyces sp. HUCO-GS316]
MTARFQWRFESSPRHLVPRWPNRQRQTAINLRLSLQTQHSPPIAGSTGPRPPHVELLVQVQPAQLDARWSKGRTRRHHD